MRIDVVFYLIAGLHLVGCGGQAEIDSYTDFARLTFHTDASSVEPRVASDGTALAQFTRKYVLENNSPMPMHVRVPPLAVAQRINSSVSQTSQNDDAFSDIAEAFGEDRTISLEPGEKYTFDITSSWFLAAGISPDDIAATFVFGLPDKHPAGLELIGEVTATPSRTEP